MTQIRTDRLLLRCARQSDLDDLFAVFGNPDAMRYWSTMPHADPSITAERIDRMIAGFADRPCVFVVERDGRAIGTVGMANGNEVGFILHPDHWRQGLMREAMTAVLPHLWRWTDEDHVWADADPDNAASVGLLESLGFVETHRKERTFLINGVWSDSVYLSLSRPAGA